VAGVFAAVCRRGGMWRAAAVCAAAAFLWSFRTGVVDMSKERDAWRALPARQRAGIAVSGSKHMATLFAHLMNAKLCNMSGSAYRCHPQCIFRNGILITDHWKTWGEYDIKIANDPSQQPARGCQDSMSRGGDPYPKIESGWTSVWASAMLRASGRAPARCGQSMRGDLQRATCCITPWRKRAWQK